MNRVIRRLRIQTYRDQLAACNQVCVALSRENQNLALPHDERLSIDQRLDTATKESLSLRFMLGHLEKQENEDRLGRRFENN